jgi:hypothetical protein
MALTDGIFSSIPGPLISQFGINATYVKASQNETYNPNTGTVSGSSVEVPVKIVIADLKPEEMNGSMFQQNGPNLYQQSTVKILIAASSLGSYYPRVTDSIKYSQDGKTRTAKIVAINSYRGDSPIMHSVIARLS